MRLFEFFDVFVSECVMVLCCDGFVCMFNFEVDYIFVIF